MELYPLHEAVRNSNLEECKRLIGTGVDINALDNKRRTALHLAAWKGSEDIVRLLILAKCKVNEKALGTYFVLIIMVYTIFCIFRWIYCIALCSNVR